MEIAHQQLSEHVRRAQGLEPVSESLLPSRRKWLAADQPNRFHGWTIIAPVPLSHPIITPSLEVLRSLRDDHAPGEWSIHPLSSLHMTVLSGMEEYIIASGDIPTWARSARDVTEVSYRALERILEANLPQFSRPLEVQVVGFSDLRDIATATVEFTSSEQAATVRQFRDAVADAVEWKRPHHDQYGFHVSFGYRLSTPPSLSEDQLHELEKRYWTLLADAGPITLEPPVFSVFESMVSFPGVYTFD